MEDYAAMSSRLIEAAEGEVQALGHDQREAVPLLVGATFDAAEKHMGADAMRFLVTMLNGAGLLIPLMLELNKPDNPGRA